MRGLILFALLWPASVLADVDSFVLGLFSLERCGFMSSSREARVDRIAECRERLDQVEGMFTALSDDIDPALVSELERNWRFIHDIYDRAIEEPELFRDHYTVDDIRVHRALMTETLGERMPQAPNPLALALLLEQAAAEYIWRASSIIGGGLSSAEVLDLGTLVVDIDRQFRQLTERYPDDYQLRQAVTQYQFIRRSLIDYNNQMVPYLVDRYATGITQVLGQLAKRKATS